MTDFDLPDDDLDPCPTLAACTCQGRPASPYDRGTGSHDPAGDYLDEHEL